jgi:hypothetical protein
MQQSIYIRPEDLIVRLSGSKSYVDSLYYKKSEKYATEKPRWGSVKSYCPELSDHDNCTTHAFHIAHSIMCNQLESEESPETHNVQKIPINKDLVANIEAYITDGISVVALLNVYNSFNSTTTMATGMVKLPDPVNWNDPQDPKDPYMGGYEICLIGYMRDKQLFTAVNSRGPEWGNNGYCYIPYTYIANSKLGLEFSIVN